MKSARFSYSRQYRGSDEFAQCSLLWKNLPTLFKTRWKSEAEKFSTSGYRLFIKTNVSNLSAGSEIQISPWH